MHRPVRIGVVGVGSLGFHHARILRDLPGADLAGIFDSNSSRTDKVASDLGVTAAASAEQLIESAEALVIAVPTSAHAEVAVPALEAGVHLLIEKPLAASLAEADEILEAAGRSGALVQTGHVERFNPALIACEPFLRGPRFIESHRLAPFNPRGTDVAVVLDLMIHDIDLVLGLAGRAAKSVSAVGVPVLTSSVDIANARLEFEGGAVANFTASRVSRERMRKIRIFQPSGYLSLDLAAGTGEFLRLRQPLSASLAEMPGSIEELVERVTFGGKGAEPLRVELEAFLAAVRGEKEVVISGGDGRAALAVALQIQSSIESHVAHSGPS